MSGIIKVMFDYGAYPIWYREDENDIFEQTVPFSDDEFSDIKIIFDELEQQYYNLFINNQKEFSYRGFKDEQSKENFIQLLKLGMDELGKLCENKYILIDETHLENL